MHQERVFARAARRLCSPATATVIGALSVLTLGGEMVMAVLVPSAAASWSVGGEDVVADVGAFLFGLSFIAVGTIVARRQPRNPMGWLLLAVATSIDLGTFAPSYAYLDYGRHHGALPFGPLAVLLSGTWIFAFALLPLAILLFPDGRLGRRWRWPLRAYLVLIALFVVGVMKVAIGDLSLRLPVDSNGNLIGLTNPHDWVGVVEAAGLASSFVLAIAAIARQVLSQRNATSEHRQQLKWLTCGAVLCLAATITAMTNPSGIVSDLVVPLGIAALPISMGVGILRYRLYDIDRLVSRTLAYAILTALLVGTFIGLVALTTDTLALSGRVGVAASTLAAAALFNPLRIRIQRLVDRRFNRARYDAEAIAQAFAARLREAVELDTIRADLLDTVQRAVAPSHASIWIKP